MLWPDEVRYSSHSLSMQSLFSYLSYSLFSWTGGVLSYQNSSSGPLSNHRRSCSSSSRLLYPLSSLPQRMQPLLYPYLSRIENPSCSACGHPTQDTFHLILRCAPRSWATPLLFSISGLGLGQFPEFWGSMVFSHAPIPRIESNKKNNCDNFDCNTHTHLVWVAWRDGLCIGGSSGLGGGRATAHAQVLKRDHNNLWLPLKNKSLNQCSFY